MWNFGDSSLRLGWCYPCILFPKEEHQCGVLLSFLGNNLRSPLRIKRRLFIHNPHTILHGNARAHTAGDVADFVQSLDCGSALPSAILSSWSPCDFDLITKMKEPLRGSLFRTVQDIFQAVDRSIRTINKLESANGIWISENRLYATLVATSKAYKTYLHVSMLCL